MQLDQTGPDTNSKSAGSWLRSAQKKLGIDPTFTGSGPNSTGHFSASSLDPEVEKVLKMIGEVDIQGLSEYTGLEAPEIRKKEQRELFILIRTAIAIAEQRVKFKKIIGGNQ